MANDENLNTESVSEGNSVEQQPEAAGGVAGQSGDVAQALEQAQAQVAELKEELLRAQAEQQNIRRRAERDVDNARKFALERFASDLLPVADNLERALEAFAGQDEAVKALAEGVELTRKNLASVLERFHVVATNPVGEPFDPQQHEAMSMVDAPHAEPNTVLHVVQKGYTLNGRLLRAAMVVVSKPAPKVDASV